MGHRLKLIVFNVSAITNWKIYQKKITLRIAKQNKTKSSETHGNESVPKKQSKHFVHKTKHLLNSIEEVCAWKTCCLA